MESVGDSPRRITYASLGRYELLKRIAVGGMAELFLARTTGEHGYEKIVALKRILASHAEDDQFIAMFLAEARLAATLHHPNIVQVHDVGDENGAYFFTMEYVFGQDVRKILRAVQGRPDGLPLELVLTIIAGTAAGLHYAHEKEDHEGNLLGIVHRDVSPSNIFVSYDGAVKLLDFGIARVTTMQASTGQGVLKGKVPYMSPEQCRGEPLDRRSDVFSLGVVLWELTTRRRLYIGENDLVIATRIVGSDAPRPSDMLPGYPKDLEAIVMKALARDREQRYASAEALQIELEDYARDHRLVLSNAKLGRFMTELFAGEIREAKDDLRKRIASVTGMFPAIPDEPAKRRTLPPVPAGDPPVLLPSPPPAPAAEPAAEPAPTEDNPSTLHGIRASQSLSEVLRTSADRLGGRLRPHRRWLGFAASGLGLLIVVFGLVCGSDDPEPLALPADAEAYAPAVPLAYRPLADPPKPKPAKKGGKRKRKR
jgi:serine/threonine protein kinase